jgi:hypothetical protein
MRQATDFGMACLFRWGLLRVLMAEKDCLLPFGFRVELTTIGPERVKTPKFIGTSI